MLIGFVLNGTAWSIRVGNPINSICLILGFSFMIGGFIWLAVMK